MLRFSAGSLMLEAANARPRFTISLNAQHPKASAIHKPPADYPIFAPNRRPPPAFDRGPRSADFVAEVGDEKSVAAGREFLELGAYHPPPGMGLSDSTAADLSPFMQSTLLLPAVVVRQALRAGGGFARLPPRWIGRRYKLRRHLAGGTERSVIEPSEILLGRSAYRVCVKLLVPL